MTPGVAFQMVGPLTEALELVTGILKDTMVAVSQIIRARSDDSLNEADRKILEMWNGLEPSAQKIVRDLLVHLYAGQSR